MNKLHFFYPENDCALGVNAPGYTGTAAAVALRLSGSALPMWTGCPGDRFLTQGVNNRWYTSMAEAFGIEVDVFNGHPEHLQPAPWGWSLPVRRVFLDAGFSVEQLPAKEDIQRLRELSHRRTSLRLGAKLHEAYPGYCGEPGIEVATMEQLERLPEDEPLVIKQPWSGSGRGVMLTTEIPHSEVLRRAGGILRRQGSVTVEKYRDNCRDFALLYEAGDGSMKFTGWSVFRHDTHFSYTSSLVADDERLKACLRKCGVRLPGDLPVVTGTVLEEILGKGYEGPLGVDFVARDGFFVPVEINLRNTMGHVAHRLAQTCLAPGVEAELTIVPMTQELKEPLKHARIHNRRLNEGLLLLNPPESDLAFVLKTL